MNNPVMKEKVPITAVFSVQSCWYQGLDLFTQLKHSDFVRRISQTFATRVLIALIGLITSVLVARTLGPEGRGAYAVAIGIGAMGVQLGNLGLQAANTYVISKQRELLSDVVATSLSVAFLIGGTASAVLGLLFTIKQEWAPLSGYLLWLALAWIPFGLSYLFLENLLLSVNEVSIYNKIELVAKLLSVFLIALILLFGFATAETVYATGLMVLVVSSAWIILCLKQHGLHAVSPSLNLFLSHIGYSLRGYSATLFAFVALRVDLFMIQYILGVGHAGHYSIAVGLIDALFMLPVTIGTILFPKLSGMRDETEKWQYARKVAVISCGMMCCVALVAWLGSGLLIRGLYGQPYEAAIPAFIWLLPGVVLLSVHLVLGNYLGSIGMPPAIVYSAGSAALVNVLLNVKLIPSLGIVGASISYDLASCTMLFVTGAYVLVRNHRLQRGQTVKASHEGAT
jgi:O-antigen/teichoic acid export membrane protein